MTRTEGPPTQKAQRKYSDFRGPAGEFAALQSARVGDEGFEPTCVSPLNKRVLRITGIPAGPNLSLGELTSRLIDRWDGMSDEERRAFEFLADWEEELVLINTN